MRLSVVVATMLVVALPACSASHPSTPGPRSTGAPAVRWWGGSATPPGSTIDPKDPTAAAAGLQPSRATYCQMLRQTLAAGHTILPGVSASDPALLTSTEAFLAELQHVAPSEVSGAWSVLDQTVVALVKSGGRSAGTSDGTAIAAATKTVANDAKSRCGVSLSA